MSQINEKTPHVPALEETILQKCPGYQKPHSFNAIPVKIPMHSQQQKKKNSPKICVQPQKTPNNQNISEKDRHIDKWNRIENSELMPHIVNKYLNKGAKSTRGEKIISSTNGTEKIKHMQKNGNEPVCYTSPQN